MAFLGYSEDFDLDDDGILRDSIESGGILIDDDGIVRDDFDLLSKHGSSTHWTDSGLGGDKPASTPSTLRQLDLQSYPSFEDVSRNLDESNVNISDLEASKDDLSFDADYNEIEDKDNGRSLLKGNRSGLSSRSSFDHSLNYDETFDEHDQTSEQKQDLFGEEYYKQLQELGVLVDENDFAHPRESLEEFENLENHYSRDYDNEENVGDEIEQFLRNDAHTPTRESMDIEGPNDLRQSEEKLYDSHGFDAFDQRNFEVNEGKRTRPNTASSTRTISSRSFPEISPEEALELYTERLQSLEHDEDLSIPFEQTPSQRTDPSDNNNDDEIYFVASQENDDEDSPKPPKMPAYDIENKPSLTPQRKIRPRSSSDYSSEDSRSGTPQGHSLGYEDSDRSRSVTPQADPEVNLENTGYQSNDERFDSLTQVTRLDSRNRTQSDIDTFRPDSALSELSSVASESRSARPKMNKAHGKPPKQQKGNLAHARSQESFFDLEAGLSPKKLEKGPKRLLPKPSAAEENQSLKIKSKSATNLNALGPVKPTHMTLSEIRNINIDIDPDVDLPEIPDLEPKSNASDVPKGELTKKLKQESSKRQQATQLVKQLQSDYDKLLSKYALAELTIDQMRLGAKISIHAASPTPSQATSGSLQSAQHLHMLQLTGAQRGSIASASPQQAQPNVFFPEAQTVQEGSYDGRGGNNQSQARGTSPALLPRSDSTNSMDSTSTPRGDVEEPGGIANDAEKVKLGLLFQARNLDERMQSFQALLGENHLTIEEQEGVFDTVRTEHEKLRRDYLQSKEDYNVLRRSTSTGLDVAFDQEKELEGELFKLGMKFDEIHEKVDDNLKEKSAKRQPFQQNRKGSTENLLDDSMEVDPSTENMKKKIRGVSAGNDLIEPKKNSEFDKKLTRLHEEYNALMDRYRRLKQMAQTPEREQEIDNLVKKLRKICKEEPDIFKMPQEVLQQQGPEQRNATTDVKPETVHHTKKLPPTPPPTNTSENKSSPEKRKPHEPKNMKSPAKSYEILTASETWSLAESIDRWEQSKLPPSEEDRQRSKSQENLHNASMASNRSFRSDRDYDSRLDDPDSGLQRRDRHGSYSSISSRGRHTPDLSSHDRDSPVPSLPRPRRHDHPDRERRERRDLKKRPDVGSTNSLQDSGISEHEGGATGGYSGPNSPLSKLPGPGKFKQMTGRRELDTDSGFIGSMVGSEVSAGNLSARRQPPQSPLRIRHPGDSPANQRPSSRQSSRSDDSARATTPRSARSVASSKSSRRTPTKAFPLGESKTTETQVDDERSKTPTRDDRRTPTRDERRTPTRDERRTPTRTDSRNKSRDQKTPQHSRDYTDDSYTSVTESEMSFDNIDPRRRNRPNSRNNTSQRNIDKIMEDSGEEQTSVKQSRRQNDAKQTTKKSQHLPSTKTPSKDTSKQSTKAKGQGQSRSRDQGQSRGRDLQQSQVTTDDDLSLTLSPTRGDTTGYTQDTTADTYTSDETTPRSVIERERKQVKQKRQSQQQQQQQPPNQETKTKRGPSPVIQTAPPQRAVTPVKKSEVHPKKLYDGTIETGPELRAAPPVGLQRAMLPQTTTQPKYVDRSIGSGTEDEILASDAETAATGATRDSVNSTRLKLLSAEIDKLRDEFKQANQEKAQQVPPPAPPQPENQYYDQYFDPTEDPMAFMRGPRRRANSFSGHGGRDWDYDWTLPNVNRDGDIPLGYAAADSYASPRRKHKHNEAAPEETRPRGRHRLRQRIHQRNTGTQHYPDQNGYDSDQSPTRGRSEEVQTQAPPVAGHYGYYPQQQTPVSPSQQPGIQGMPPGATAQMQPGRRVFGSQPNLAFTGYQPPPAPHSTASGSTKSSTGHTNSTQRPLRQTLYSYAANPTQNRPAHGPGGQNYHNYQTRVPFSERPYANDDIHVNDGQTRFIPNGASDVHNAQGEGGVYTSSCPLCGSSSYHTHGDFVYPPPDHRVPLGYLVHDGRGDTRSRGRSRSQGRNGRIRHYSPDGRMKSRYFVREYGDVESESAESAEEELPRRRSRSVGRRRPPRHGRKYKRVRGEDEYESDRGLSRGSLSLKRSESQPDLHQKGTSDDEKYSTAAEDDLNRSLRLVGEIDDLTNKMMGTVSGELARSRRMKEFGSSVW